MLLNTISRCLAVLLIWEVYSANFDMASANEVNQSSLDNVRSAQLTKNVRKVEVYYLKVLKLEEEFPVNGYGDFAFYADNAYWRKHQLTIDNYNSSVTELESALKKEFPRDDRFRLKVIIKRLQVLYGATFRSLFVCIPDTATGMDAMREAKQYLKTNRMPSTKYAHFRLDVIGLPKSKHPPGR